MVDRRAQSLAAGLALILILTAEGCSPTTRLPSIFPGPGDTDKRSFNVHDPLPETNIGPDTGARPPGFMQEWSEPRRTREAQGVLGVPPNGGVPGGAGAPMVPGGPVPGGPPGGPIGPGPSSQLYPDVVPQ
jgi:hypothetical protein